MYKKFFNIFLLFLIFVCINKIPAQEKGWKIVDTNISIDSIKHIYFSDEFYMNLKCADSLNCMALVLLDPYRGYMFRRTTDGGETWKNVFIDTASNPNRPDYLNMPSIYDIAYPNEKLFIGVGDSGVIVRTTDKGETWSKMKYDTNIAFGTICMMDKKFGIISGCAGNCDNDSNFINLVTDDGGLTWDKLNSNLIFRIYVAWFN